MAFRQVVAASLAVLLAVGASPLLAQQGAISGIATDEAESPYSDFAVRLVNPATGEIIGAAQTLDAEGRFSFSGLPIGQDYMVELIDTTDNDDVVCTEGPFDLTQEITAQTGINIDCGGAPAALWILAGAAAVVTAVGLACQSTVGVC
jgi:hypothetical protein